MMLCINTVAKWKMVVSVLHECLWAKLALNDAIYIYTTSSVYCALQYVIMDLFVVHFNF